MLGSMQTMQRTKNSYLDNPRSVQTTTSMQSLTKTETILQKTFSFKRFCSRFILSGHKNFRITIAKITKSSKNILEYTWSISQNNKIQRRL